MELKDIRKDGRAFKKGSRYVNSRTRVHTEVIVVTQANKGLVTYVSTRRSAKTVSVAEFAQFVEDTFGGWEDKVIPARPQADTEAKAAKEAAKLVERIEYCHGEALTFEAFVQSIVASGAATQDEVYGFTVRAVVSATISSYERGKEDGYSEGYEEGDDAGYERGYDLASSPDAYSMSSY